ncbi:hypothetical protein NDU88_005135 [Pleurodeles waltl]|uniref:Uncharacterized protein n=1 Tax=Pleurodeles waltl TaxID=8319 RepID=A0AAV7NLI3_PLEWA|nr:hypothetical protein NDU88_005135 [Pleurodeles waltl]
MDGACTALSLHTMLTYWGTCKAIKALYAAVLGQELKPYAKTPQLDGEPLPPNRNGLEIASCTRHIGLAPHYAMLGEGRDYSALGHSAVGWIRAGTHNMGHVLAKARVLAQGKEVPGNGDCTNAHSDGGRCPCAEFVDIKPRGSEGNLILQDGGLTMSLLRELLGLRRFSLQWRCVE